MGATGRLWLAASLVLAAALAFPAPAHPAGAGTSLRFTGSEGGVTDRAVFPVYLPAQHAETLLNVGDYDFTVELWVRGRAADNTAPAMSCSNDRHWTESNVILDRDRHGQSRDFGFGVAGGRPVAGVHTQLMTRMVCGTASILDDRWHHIVLQQRYDVGGNGTLSLFVDGALAGSVNGVNGSSSYPPGGEPLGDCPGPCVNDPFLMIGGGKVSGVPAFRGFIDEMRVSNVTRYSQSGFFRPLSPFSPDANTVGLYHFDEASGTTIRDASSGATHGTRRVTSAGGPEWWTATPFVSGPGARVGASTPRATASSSAAPRQRSKSSGARVATDPASTVPSVAPAPVPSKKPVQAFFPSSSKSLAGPPPIAIALAGVGIAIAVAVHFLRSDRDGERL